MEPNRFKGTWLGKGKNVPKAVICRARDIGARDPFAHATIKFRARDNADRMDPRGAEEASVDVAAWLHGLGLQQYEQAFRENATPAALGGDTV